MDSQLGDPQYVRPRRLRWWEALAAVAGGILLLAGGWGIAWISGWHRFIGDLTLALAGTGAVVGLLVDRWTSSLEQEIKPHRGTRVAGTASESIARWRASAPAWLFAAASIAVVATGFTLFHDAVSSFG